MARRNNLEVEELGYHFGKRDLDRVGFFDDTPAGPFGEYKTIPNFHRTKEKQFISGQPGNFFDRKFKRLFEGERVTNERDGKSKEKTTGPHIVPTAPTKLHSTPNDWFGCIGKPISYLSPALKSDEKIKPEHRLPNFKIKPGPIGGSGYVNICLNPYPEHADEPYYDRSKIKKTDKTGKFLSAIKGPEYFTPNPYLESQPGPTYVHPSDEKFRTNGARKFYMAFPKDPGGMHDGCFSKFPEYLNETHRERKLGKHAPVPKFILGGLNSKSKYTFSIIDRVTKVSCNANNFLQYQERVYPKSR